MRKEKKFSASARTQQVEREEKTMTWRESPIHSLSNSVTSLMLNSYTNCFFFSVLCHGPCSPSNVDQCGI